jgi:hypothetical protein
MSIRPIAATGVLLITHRQSLSWNDSTKPENIAHISAHGVSTSFVVSKPIDSGSTLLNNQYWPTRKVAPSESYPFVVIGDGVAGRAAVATLREHTPSASVLVLGISRPAVAINSDLSQILCADGTVHIVDRSESLAALFTKVGCYCRCCP